MDDCSTVTWGGKPIRTPEAVSAWAAAEALCGEMGGNHFAANEEINKLKLLGVSMLIHYEEAVEEHADFEAAAGAELAETKAELEEVKASAARAEAKATKMAAAMLAEAKAEAENAKAMVAAANAALVSAIEEIDELRAAAAAASVTPVRKAAALSVARGGVRPTGRVGKRIPQVPARLLD